MKLDSEERSLLGFEQEIVEDNEHGGTNIVSSGCSVLYLMEYKSKYQYFLVIYL
jgi:hypothetical protein